MARPQFRFSRVSAKACLLRRTQFQLSWILLIPAATIVVPQIEDQRIWTYRTIWSHRGASRSPKNHAKKQFSKIEKI